MKKRVIWTISGVMCVAFIVLLYLQLTYIRSMTRMKREQFSESVSRALYQTARNLELNETLRYLEQSIYDSGQGDSTQQQKPTIRKANKKEIHQPLLMNSDGTFFSSFDLQTMSSKLASVPRGAIQNSDRLKRNGSSQSLQNTIYQRYVYQRATLDELVYRMLYTASEKSLQERINFLQLDQDLTAELRNNGIDMEYHFVVETSDGRVVHRCPDYDNSGSENSYTQVLFRNDPSTKLGVLRIHFPEINKYIFSSIKFVIPSLIFTFVLLVTFIFTVVIAFRQKRVSEIRNDFINNMTHELKTPISSISLASQMLSDTSVKKSDTMIEHLGNVINTETRRLRFLVEKVLQMSMFDRQKAIYNKKEIDINETLEQIASTFELRVAHTKGKIITLIEAVDSKIFVDEMHFQNVIFNLIDNAVKYCKQDSPLMLYVKTWNPDDKHVSFQIKDNGIGIRKEDLKQIFDKFYRVHTGNVHNVKGFGLGLAYVKQIVDIHGGTIQATSEYRQGTEFTITLPLYTNNDIS